MFSFFRKKETKPAKPKRTVVGITNEEREIATKYGLTFENYIAMRKEVCSLNVRWGRPLGAKTRKKKVKKNVAK